jgi:hypothetical protein
LTFDPDNKAIIAHAADALYDARRMDDARPLYERLEGFQIPGRPVDGSVGTTMRMAETRRRGGDEAGAQEAARISREDLGLLMDAGYKDQFIARGQAMIAAFDRDPDTAIAAIEKAIDRGMRDPGFLRDPIFDGIRDGPRFLASVQKIAADLARQHKEVLQMICFKNPVPHAWRPLPETCAGVKKENI